MTKREVLADIMRTSSYDIMLLGETNVNVSSCEKRNGYTYYFSTDIDAKIKEQEEKRREQNQGTTPKYKL